MKVKVLSDYKDLQLNKVLTKGHEHTVTAERGKHLVGLKLVEEVKDKKKD